MLILCHLFLGVIIGLGAYLLLRNEWVLFAVILGSVLPDLLDKPLGHIILSGDLDNGRIFFHGLMAIGIVMVAALITIRTRYGIILGGLALGMLSHQLLDAMWLDPVSWFFPILGPYVPDHYPDYFLQGLWAEITSPTEWLFLFVSASLLFPLTCWRWGWISDRWKERLGRFSDLVLRVGPWLLGVAGITILVTASITAFEDVEELTATVILGTTCLIGSMFLLAWGRGERLGYHHIGN